MKGRQFYWHFHFHRNLIPITSARSGANFCFSLTSASEGRVGGEKREQTVGASSEEGEVLKLCLAAMLGKCQWR